MKIADHNTQDRVLIIAEIGNNHEGNLDVARELVASAAKAGVDAVKFQTFQTDWFVAPQDQQRVERMRRFELRPSEFADLQRLSHDLGLLFISTPLDLPSAEVLDPLVDAFKVASGDNNFYPLLDRLCETGKPMIVSTGVSDITQVQATQDFIQESWNRRGRDGQLAILHCVSNYPTATSDANLRAIPQLRLATGVEIGYSDHTLGVTACELAVALGATIIEKHFTLDKHFSDFRDHAIAADPEEMARLVEQIRLAETLLGDGVKQVADCEQEMAAAIRRSIVAARALPAGHCLSAEDLTWMRPGSGLAPGQEPLLLGTRLNRDLGRGEPILLGDVTPDRSALQRVEQSS